MKKYKQIHGIIYKAISPSGKIYIGQTSQKFIKRKRDHLNKANNPNSKEYNNKFANAIRKYGEQLIWEVVIENISTYEELNNLEIALIKQYDSMNNGYNSTAGGKNGPLSPDVIKKLSGENNHNYGKHMPKKVRVKVSKSKTNPSQETRELLSKAAIKRFETHGHPFAGKHHSKKTKQKLSQKTAEYFKNNPQAKELMSQKAKHRFSDPKEREALSASKGGKAFDVFKLDTGEYVGTWINQTECALILNSTHQAIGKCLNGKYKSSQGYIFIYHK